MIKLSKKAISAISISSAAIIAGGTVTAGILIKNNKSSEEDKKTTNPLNRDKSYHKYSIVNKIKSNPKLSNLIKLEKSEDFFIYVIDEKKFTDNIKTILQEALQSINLFSANWNSYKLEVSYKLVNTSLIKIDLVWYLPNSKIKYFDQFELMLQFN